MSFILDDLMGSILTLILLALAGAESAFGLSLLVSYYNQRNTISIK
jgi:NADH-ubiquinone oxidoreductase chain 4L